MKPAVFIDVEVFRSDAESDARASDVVNRLRGYGLSVVVIWSTKISAETGVAGASSDEAESRELESWLSMRDVNVDGVYKLDPLKRDHDAGPDSGGSATAALATFRLASVECGIELAESWIVAASADGLLAVADEVGGGAVHVTSGHEALAISQATGADVAVERFAEAASWIREQMNWKDTPEWLPTAKSGATPPFFIVGAERSGSTLFRLILSAHEKVACHSEFEYVVDWLDPKTGSVSLDEFRDHLVGHRKFPTLFEVREELTPVPQIDVDQRTVARAFLEQYRREIGRPIIGATVHRNFDRVLHIWPEARFIHIYRDPRDVVRSVVQMGWAGTPYHGAFGWLHAEEVWQSMAKQLDPNRILDVQYEKLVESPAKELTRICKFLGVEYSDAMLNYHEHTSYGVLDPAMTYKWRSKMSPRDVRLVETLVGDRLTELSYARSGLPALEPSSFLSMRLAVENRIGRLRWRLRRYGFKLVIWGSITRRLGMKEAHARARRAIQDIDNAQLK